VKRTATHWGAYEVEAAGGRVTSLRPPSDDPEPSPIGPGMPEALVGPLRITQPMARRGWLEHGPANEGRRRGSDPMVPIPWDDALDLAAREIGRVREQHGNASIFGGSYGWGSAGRFHHPQSQVHRFLRACGGYTDSVGSYSFAAMETLMPHVTGGDPLSMLFRGPSWHAFGGLATKNSQANPGGVGRHVVGALQRACRDAGVAFVNVSPHRDDMAPELGADWVPLRPGTDTAVMLALAYVLIAEDRYDREFATRCCAGFERWRDYLFASGHEKTPDWAGAISEVEPEQIRSLARRIAAGRTVITASWSLQRGDHGEQPYWAATALAAISGSMGRPGGGIGLGYGATHGTGVGPMRPGVAALPQGDNPVEHVIPVARIADALLHPGTTIDFDGRRVTYPDLRLVYWCGGNPFHHHQDLNRLREAWQRPESIIVHEPYWNPLARHADLVFPVAIMTERNDIAAGASDEWLLAMERCVDPPPGVRSDYEVFAAIAERLGVADEFTEGRTADEWVEELYDSTRAALDGALPSYAQFRAAGKARLPLDPQPESDFAALRGDPDAHPLPTPSGRVEIFSETIDGFGYDDCPGHPTWLEPAEWLGSPLSQRFPIHLLSNQPATRLHSQYDHGALRRAAKVAGREAMRVSPADAAARGLANGDVARVWNDRGACLAGVIVTDALRPGVAILPTGAWWDPDDDGTDRHGNPNAVTLDRGTSRLAQAPIAQTTLVEIERYDGPPPPVRAFDPPVSIRLQWPECDR